VLLDHKKEIPSNATPQQIKKINRQNERIARENANRIKDVKQDLNEYYNGAGGAKTSSGENVFFKFNVSGLGVVDTKGGTDGNVRKIAAENSLESSFFEFPSSTKPKDVPAAVVTTRSGGSGHGRALGEIIGLDVNAPSGTVSHEVGHTLALDDNYSNGGVMASPGTYILRSEVDKIIEKSYER